MGRTSLNLCQAAWRLVAGDEDMQSPSAPGQHRQPTADQHDGGELQQLLESERAARSAAEREGRIKDEFLSTLSHEIRTPLSAVLGWAQITRKATSMETIRKGLEVIERNARAQIQIVNDMLDMSAILSGKVQLHLRRLDLPATLQVAIENARPMADAKGITILSSINVSPTFSLNGDAGRLQQVLWNLLSNAIKFTPPGGSIHVSLTRADSHLELAVADSGEGIAADFLPFVFDRFRQADASTTRRHGGLGLGLAIVRQIAELHGGSVRVSSPGVGLGSTFVVSLPTAAAGAVQQGEDWMAWRKDSFRTINGAGNRSGIDGVRVLVVDDEPDSRDLIHQLLAGQGAAVDVADSARDAFDKLKAHAFDLMICDIGMPEEDGYSLLQRVRSLPAHQCGQIAAIALTAFARPVDRMRALAAGFSMHVVKPVDTDELVRIVAMLAPTPDHARRLQGSHVATPKVSS
jgi:signal transduction histidine kinase/ActR/RegA family two-component response regulator